MAANAYQGGPEGEWEDLGNFWDTKHSFGWRRDGIRGHVFASEDNSTIVISFKGTSAALFLGGGTETSVNDKFNDNRLFSCCCARVDFSWSPVCDCYMGNNMCNATCIDNSLNDDPDIYFHAAANIFMDVTRAYPDSHIVLVGHSLGGSIASLLGLTFGVPVVAYEAPGEALAARRLHLPVPTDSALMGVLPTWHIGHTADPIYMGVCTGPTSSCYYAGYAMESSCHLGQQCVFDTVRLKDWRLDIRHHRINEVIYLMLEPWGLTNLDEKWPKCLAESDECEDCGLWSFVNGDDDGDSNHNGGDDGGGESLNSDTP
ncbi:putative lipase atg15 [Spiromyces aspiralis]|uniref:Lipase atg15 n=1 Tax=Spiromyces aspiralis TaxID=68401 RepID=A0ACC1HAZ7_9FUNG|nr:putative lipase atg15 [Spiromyces aspiralis]